MANPFVRPVEQYRRNLDIRRGYVRQNAKYISLMLRRGYTGSLKFVQEKIKEGKELAIKDPAMTQLISKAKGHRVEDTTSFLNYVQEITDSGRIVSPSMVVYERPEVEKSVTAEWQDDNIKARKTSKKAMFQFKQLGEMLKSALADYDQNARKIRINSVSGQRGFEGNALYLATGHSSLTSLCRAAAGYGNATVERFLMGSKHYHTPEIARANLMAILTIENLDRMQETITKYDLVYPTAQDVVDMVEYSGRLYWRIPHELEKFLQLAEGMTPLERAAVVYSGDMFHVAKHNPDIIRQMMSELIALDLSDIPDDIDTDVALKSLDATDIAYVNALCASVLKGTTHELVKENNPEGWKTIGKTAQKFMQSSAKWSDFISGLFVPDHLPPTVASLKSIQRRACLAADTDSSIFTTEYWVQWYSGNMIRGEVNDRIWYLATYMACQCIAHSLAMLSANVGVEVANTFRLAMKNEYGFPVFARTNLAKHYYALMSMREGNIYEEDETETKGVGLRGSSTQKQTLQGGDRMRRKILDAANNSEQISAKELLEEVAKFELDTIRSIMRGEYTYLKSASIKPETNKVPYFEMWQEVFGPKYGESIQPPIPVVKVTTELVNKTKTQEWLAEIEDRALAERMIAWMAKHGRTELPTVYLPTMSIKQCGLPVEIQSAANVRKLTYQINEGFYRTLESTGLHIVDRNNYRLVFDFLGMKI
jgi:hypothetical protein